MSLRLVEVFIPASRLGLARSVLDEHETIEVWHEELADGHAQLHVLVEADGSEAVTDALESVLSTLDRFRVISLPVEASIPRHGPEEKKTAPVEDRKAKQVLRVSRDEIYSDVSETTQTSWTSIVLSMLSAVVAAVGLSRDSIAIIIGAMVIAPLLGPNVALALATTLGDLELAGRALRENATRLLSALAVAALFGLLFRFDPQVPEIAS
ncbi:DUF389 domain-containing protein, partial [Candidatus Fermentibacterales bacterium]|nr:DUF389 domain-containing protein [Candidatus Fermentibacterales bacterium]